MMRQRLIGASMTTEPRTHARDVLKRVFGYDSFRPGQEEVVMHLASGHDAFVLLPTGGGKSICYQVPGLMREGLTLVITPLISLMKDQVDGLIRRGVESAYLGGHQGEDEKREIAQKIRDGQLQFLYVSPERLEQERFRSFLKSVRLALFAIDEAHCVSQWGHDFRDSYRHVGEALSEFTGVPRVALTATADPVTRVDVLESLDLREARSFVGGFDRKNITISVTETPEGRILDQVTQYIAGQAGKTGIIYRSSRKGVEETARELQARGVNAVAYHAGMPSEQRMAVQDRFIEETEIVIVATVAFGMGIDRPDVRYVVHMDPPSTLEGYYQEIGRAGRDGAASEAVMFYPAKAANRLRQKVEMNEEVTDDRKAVLRTKVDNILAFLETPTCRRATLLRYFGENAAQECGNCDRCLQPPQSRDGYPWARMAVSAALQTGEKYGAKSLVTILSPALVLDSDERAKRSNIACYAAGTALNQDAWKKIFRQMVGSGYLEISPQKFGALEVTSRGRSLLKVECRVPMIGSWHAIAPTLDLVDEQPLVEGQRHSLTDGLREHFRRMKEICGTALESGEVRQAEIVRIIEAQPETPEQVHALTENEAIRDRAKDIAELFAEPGDAEEFSLSIEI